jgi:hypothetical protein
MELVIPTSPLPKTLSNGTLLLIPPKRSRSRSPSQVSSSTSNAAWWDLSEEPQSSSRGISNFKSKQKAGGSINSRWWDLSEDNTSPSGSSSSKLKSSKNGGLTSSLNTAAAGGVLKTSSTRTNGQLINFFTEKGEQRTRTEPKLHRSVVAGIAVNM